MEDCGIACKLNSYATIPKKYVLDNNHTYYNNNKL